MKIVVLGATGQIGSLLYQGLRKHHQVLGTSRKPSPAYIRFDPFSDDWSRLGKVDVLLNCIGQIQPADANTFYRTHVELPRIIIENRKVIGKPRIIQVSALGAAVEHRVEFLSTKGIGDEILLAYDDVVVVRPSIVCTPGTMLVKKMEMLFRISQYTGGYLFLPKEMLESKIQPVMPSTLQEVVQAICVHPDPAKVVEVVGSEQLSFRDVINLMFEAKRKECRVLEVPKLLLDFFVKSMITTLFSRLVYSQQYDLLFEDNVADTTALKKIIAADPLPARQFFKNEFAKCQ